MSRTARQPPPETVALFTGKRGSGKSYRLARWARDVYRVAAWDPKAEHVGWLGGPRMSSAEFLARARAGEFSRGVLRVSVGPTLGDEIPTGLDLPGDFDLFAAGCWAAGALCVLCEELPLAGATAAHCPPGLESIVNVGRGQRALSVVVVAQRPALVPTLIRGQASEWWAHKQTSRLDAEAVAEAFGLTTAEADVRTLPKFAALHWTADTNSLVRVGPDGHPLAP